METPTTKNETEQPAVGGCDASACYALKTGEILQRGDFFVDDGQEFHMDKLGRIMGLRVLGHPVKKDGSWYRHNTKDNLPQ